MSADNNACPRLWYPSIRIPTNHPCWPRIKEPLQEYTVRVRVWRVYGFFGKSWGRKQRKPRKQRTPNGPGTTCYADDNNCPKADQGDAWFAFEAAKELKGIIDCIDAGVAATCKFKCEESIACEHCENLSRPACPGTRVGVEFLADTGSEEDLMSVHDMGACFPESPVQDHQTC